MLAVIKTGGKQYKVKVGDKVRLEKLATGLGQPHVFDEVLLVGAEDGSSLTLGAPTIKNARVEAKVLQQGRAKKVVVRKFRAKVRYARTRGHRQHYTQAEITKI